MAISGQLLLLPEQRWSHGQFWVSSHTQPKLSNYKKESYLLLKTTSIETILSFQKPYHIPTSYTLFTDISTNTEF